MSRQTLRIDDEEVARRIRIIRYATGFPGHGGQTAMSKKYRLESKRWSKLETLETPVQNDDVVLIKNRVMPGITMDWVYLGLEDGLPGRLRSELEAAAEAVDRDFPRKEMPRK